jgi:hypothetical protein
MATSEMRYRLMYVIESMQILCKLCPGKRDPKRFLKARALLLSNDQY